MEREPQKDFRDIQGEWTREQVETLAQSMLTEPDFTYIPWAGDLLQKNLQGEPSFSEANPLFADDTLKVITTPRIPNLNEYVTPVAQAEFEMTGPYKELVLCHKNGGESLAISTPTELRFKAITLSHCLVAKRSPAFLKHVVAKEIAHISSFDFIATVGIDHLSDDYHIPKQEEARHILKLFSLFGFSELFQDVLPLMMADIWAHFLTVPDYLLAKDKGLLTEQDDRGSPLPAMAKHFLSVGALREEGGRYKWTEEGMSHWFSLAPSLASLLKTSKEG